MTPGKTSFMLILELHLLLSTCAGEIFEQNAGTVHFGLMMSTETQRLEKEKEMIAGITAAIETINNNSDLLANYTLNFTHLESQCTRNKALSTFFEHVSYDSADIKAVIDLSCTPATVATAEVSHIFGLSQLSCASSSPVLGDRGRFQRYFQLLPSSSAVAHSHVGLTRQFNWSHVAFLVEDIETHILETEATKSLLSAQNISYSEYVFDSDGGLAALETHPFDVPEERIFIIAASEKQIINILCEASQRGLRYPSHLFITFLEFENDWSQITNSAAADSVCSQLQIESVLKNSLAVSNLQPSFESKVINQGEWSPRYSPYCYDATFAFALALNMSLSNRAENQTILDGIFEQLNATSFSFEGETGTVEFDNNGIRKTKSLPIFQYRLINDTSDSGVVSNLTLVKIGQIFQADLSFSYESNESDETVWRDGIPSDGREGPDVFTRVFLPITIIFSVLASIGIILSVICLIFNIAFRNRKVVRITSPTLNYLILGGAILFYIDVYFFVAPTFNPTEVRLTCNITVWLSVIAYTFCFGTIMAKMFRVWIIFRDPKPGSRKVVKDWTLVAGVLVLLALDLIFLTIYTAIEQTLNPDDLTIIVVNDEIPVEEGKRFVRFECESRVQEIVVGIYYGFKAILQIIAFILAFLTRKVKVKGLDDAKYIAAVIYITSLILATITICQFTITALNTNTVIFSTGLTLGPTCVLGILFVPTMVRLYKDPDGKSVFVIPTTATHCTAQSQEIDSLKARIRELEELAQPASYSATDEEQAAS